MKKFIFIIFFLLIVEFFAVKYYIIKNIKIDGVYELDNKTITIEINGDYYDYEVEPCYYKEVEK